MFDNSKKLCVFILMVPKVPKYPFYFHYTKDLEHELSHIVVAPCKDVEILVLVFFFLRISMATFQQISP